MKVLIPTDFSPLSSIATNYGVQLAKQLNASVELLHAAYIQGPPRAMMKYSHIITAMKENAKMDFDDLLKEINVPKNTKINCHTIHGHPVSVVVNNFVTQHKCDLVVMGTKGATGLNKVILGSNASATLQHCSVPVLTIPGEASFRKTKRIVYATDLKSYKSEVRKLLAFARKLNAKITLLHIETGTQNKKINANSMARELQESNNYKSIEFIFEKAQDVVRGVEHFINNNKVDILAVFPHEKKFFHRLFGKSISKELVFHNRIPILTLP